MGADKMLSIAGSRAIKNTVSRWKMDELSVSASSPSGGSSTISKEASGSRSTPRIPLLAWVLLLSLAGALAGGGDLQFRRGDPNGDAVLDLADAITILKALTGGDPDIGCADAADVDDSGKL